MSKPHIQKTKNTWTIYRSRFCKQPIGLTTNFKKLSKVGPWRPAEYQGEYFGDAKKPI